MGTSIDRRRFLTRGGAALLAVAGGALAMPVLASTAPIPLSTLSSYFNGMRAVAAEFTQINPDSTISTGDVLIRRPGRMRFNYDAPEDTLVIAGGGQIAVFDGKSNSVRPEQYPLNKTPLGLILEPRVDLTRARMVTNHYRDGVKTTVRAQDPAHPEYGSIDLVFTEGPVQLRQWVVRDGQGAETTVILGQLDADVTPGASNFSIVTEINRRTR